jgi:alcohol dehydrogenase class IV
MNQKTFIFPGSIKMIPSIISELNNSNILLIRGNNSFEKSGARKELGHLLKDATITEFRDFSVNPKLSEAKKGYELFTKNNIDLILAVGGGSVIDMSKIINYLHMSNNNFKPITNIPIVAVPTTAGTGSEATHFAVVYINGVKDSFAHKYLLPRYAIVDANLLQGQTAYQMAVSGLDAFSQAIESYWSTHSTTKSASFSKKAIRLIWNNLYKAINGDQIALTNMAEGSNFAGKAINITKTTAPHSLSYGFTSMFGLPHGHAVALFLPFFIKYHYGILPEQCNDVRGANFVNKKICEIEQLLNISNQELEKKISEFIKNCGIEINFKYLNILKEDYEAALLLMNADRLKNNPGKINDNLLKKIFDYNLNA